jgi:hypothetical protein
MINVSVGLFAVALVLTVVAGAAGVKSPRLPEVVPSARRVAGAKLLAVLRLIGCAALAFGLASLVADAASQLAPPLRWPIWLLAGSGSIAVLINWIAGLWLLSPWIGADPGREIQVSHLRGTIHGYGWFRLAIYTSAGWLAHIPYASFLFRPVLMRREDGARAVVLTFRREHWTPDQTRYLRQAAILCPYRDPSYPVTVSLRARTLEVRLGLALGASEERVRALLEHAIDHHPEPRPVPAHDVPENAR